MKRFVPIMIVVSLVIAGLVSYFASPSPDGLERVAEDKGFLSLVKEPVFSLLPDYSIPGLPGFLSNGLAGAVGVLATFGAVTALGFAVRRRKHDGAPLSTRPER
jgi:cobalt/nickel transport protein